MLTAHHVVAVAVLAVTALAALFGWLHVARHGTATALSAHLLALAQTLLVAQVALGLLLLSDGKRAPEDLHYLYGALALAAVLAPWLYAPRDPHRRLVWFAAATLVAALLAARAYMTS